MPDSLFTFDVEPAPVRYARKPRTKTGVRLEGVDPELVDFAARHDLLITSGREGRHNPGSAHGGGGALDFRTRDLTPERFGQVREAARAEGLNLGDERARPSGQRVWGGPHGHLSKGAKPPANLLNIETEPDSLLTVEPEEAVTYARPRRVEEPPAPVPPATLVENDPAVLAPVRFYGETPEQIVQNREAEAKEKERARKVAAARARAENLRRRQTALRRQAEALNRARREEQTGQLSVGGLRERDNALIQAAEGERLRQQITSLGEVRERDEQYVRRNKGRANVSGLGEIRAEDERRGRAEPAEIEKDRAFLESVPFAARTPQMPGQPDLNDPAQLRAARLEGEAQAAAPTAEELARRERVSRMGWGEYAAQIPKSVVTGLEGMASSSLKGLGILSAGPGGALVPLATVIEGVRGTREAKDALYYRAGEKLDEWTQYAVQSNPDLEQDVKVGKLPNAFGSMAGFVLGGWASKAPKVAALVLGGLSGGSQVYEEVKQLGGSESQAQLSALVGMGVLGPLEMAGGAPAVVERLNQGAKGAAWRALLKEALKDAGKEAAEEGLQEGASEFATGVISGKHRKLREVLEAAGIGAVSGGLMSGAGSAVNAARAAAEAPPVKTGTSEVETQPQVTQSDAPEPLETPGAPQPKPGETREEYLDRAIREAEAELQAIREGGVKSESARPAPERAQSAEVVPPPARQDDTQGQVAAPEVRADGRSEEVEVAAPRQFEHVQFGRVTEEGSAGKGKVKVVDEAGAEHVIQEPKANGRGNERAVPVRQGIRITPKAQRGGGCNSRKYGIWRTRSCCL